MSKDKNKSNIIILFVSLAGMMLVLALFAIMRFEDNRVITTNIDNYILQDSEDTIYSEEDKCKDSKGNVYIEGYFSVKGLSYDFFNYANDNHDKGVYANFQFCIIDGEVVYVMPTKLEETETINNLLNDGNNYRYAIFKTRIPNKYVNIINNAKKGIVSRTPDGEEYLYIYD